METASVIFKHDFDDETLQELSTLRMVRLALAERQLANLDQTIGSLYEKGLIQRTDTTVKRESIREELLSKISLLRERIDQKEVVFADELEFYLKLVKPD